MKKLLRKKWQNANIVAGGLDMKLVDRTKLQSVMVERGLSIKDIAAEIGLTYSAAYAKIRQNRDFSENEICILLNTLNTNCFLYDVMPTKRKRYEKKLHNNDNE